MIPRSPRAIAIFCIVYLALQMVVIVRGHFVPSKHFAFWMFPETTMFVARLVRVTSDGQSHHVPGGTWIVPRPSGELVTYRWRDFVRGYRLDALDVKARSKGTLTDTLRYFHEAVKRVARQIPEDRETIELVLRIDYQRAGEAPEHVELRSGRRPEATP